jgi:hypothetical protein
LRFQHKHQQPRNVNFGASEQIERVPAHHVHQPKMFAPRGSDLQKSSKAS